MADGGSRPPTPPASTFGPRVVAAALVIGVGTLVAVMLGPVAGGRAAAGSPSNQPTANASESPDDQFENNTIPTNRLQALGDVRQLRMRVGGLVRTALVYRPASAHAGSPVFVAVHGYTSSAQAIVRHTSFIDLAQRNGWIVVFPQGLRYAADGQRAWNAGTCCGGAPTAHTSDVAFIVRLARYVVSSYDANPKQLFYVGHSNGAMLGYRIACTAKQPFAGFGLLSGTLVTSCDHTTKVPLLEMHGLQDPTVPFQGSRWRVSLQTRLQPVTETLDTIASLNGCRGALASRSPAGAEVRVFTSTCPRSATVALVTVRDMQHQWTESAERYGIDETRYATTWLLEHSSE